MNYSLSTKHLPHYWFSGYKNFKPGEVHVQRTCPQDVLLLVYRGTLNFIEDDIPVSVTAGQYYIQRKGLFQRGDRPSDAKYYFIHFQGKWQENTAAMPVRGEMDYLKIEPLCRKLEYMQLSERSAVEINGVFYAILSHLLEKQESVGKKRMVEQIVEGINNSLAVPVSLENLSQKFGYSQNQLINLFKRETGYTPMAYITKLRIRAAKRQLAYSSGNMDQVARSCGFGSYVNFYKAFVKEVGCSPLAWRKRYNEGLVDEVL